MKKVVSLLLTVLMTLCVLSVNVLAFDNKPAELTVKVKYVVHANPVLTVPSEKTIFKGEKFNPLDVVVSAKDDEGTDLKSNVGVSGQYDINTVGSYTLKYSVTDSFGGSDEKTFKLNVIEKLKEENTSEQVTVKEGAPVKEVEADIKTDSIVDSVVREEGNKTSTLTPEQKQAIKDGASVKLELTVDSTANDSTNEDSKVIDKAIKEANSSTAIGALLDINLLCTVTRNNESLGTSKITVTSEPVKVTVTVPDTLVNTDSTVTRDYDVARLHDGKVDLLGAKYDAASKKLTFDTSLFSTYAIVYTDTKVEQPKNNTSSSSSSSGYKKPVVNTAPVYNLTLDSKGITIVDGKATTNLNVTDLDECEVLTLSYEPTLTLKSSVTGETVESKVSLTNRISNKGDFEGKYPLTVTVDNSKKHRPGTYKGTIEIIVTCKEYEARIGDEYYDTLQEALSDVNANQTVILLKDVAGAGVIYNKDVEATLDLNSYTYKAVSNGKNTSHRVIMIAAGNLTIQNGILDARNEVDGTDDRTDSAMYGTVRAESGNVVLKNLTLYNNHDWGMSIKICKGYTGVIEKCNVYSKVGGGLEAEGGTVVVRNSTFNQEGYNPKFQYIASGLAASEGGVIDIYNATFTTEGNYAVYIYNSGATINVHGGEFIGKIDALHADTPSQKDSVSNSVINVFGGNFNGTIYEGTGEGNGYTAEVNISGGTFTVDPSKYLTEGYRSRTISDNRFAVESVRESGYVISTQLPEGPSISGDVWTVNPENAQYTLDGAYGSIDGKTINFSSGTYIDNLILGRPTKYSGSNTEYRHGSHESQAMTYEDYIAYKNQDGWTEYSYYSRNINNVTFTSDEGAVLPGFVTDAGAHDYGSQENPVYDYVRDSGVWCYDTNYGYYTKCNLSNFTFDGLIFAGNTNISTSAADTVIDGFTFRNCSFTTNGTDQSKGQALRYYNESNNGNVKNLTVDNCTFKNCYQGVYTQKINGVTVKNS